MPRPVSVTSASVCSSGWSTPGALVIRPLRSVPHGARVRSGPDSDPAVGNDSCRPVPEHGARPRRAAAAAADAPTMGDRPSTGREGAQRGAPTRKGQDRHPAVRAGRGAQQWSATQPPREELRCRLPACPSSSSTACGCTRRAGSPGRSVPGGRLRADPARVAGRAGHRRRGPGAPGEPGGGGDRADRSSTTRGSSRSLPEPPVLIGHSFGGLVVRSLLDRGLGRAGVAIDPAQIRGVVRTPPAQLRVGLPGAPQPGQPQARGEPDRRPVPVRASATRCPARNPTGCTSSGRSPGPAGRCSRRPGQLRTPKSPRGHGRRHPARPTRAPLLIVPGARTGPIPDSVSRAAFKMYGKSAAVTEFRSSPTAATRDRTPAGPRWPGWTGCRSGRRSDRARPRTGGRTRPIPLGGEPGRGWAGDEVEVDLDTEPRTLPVADDARMAADDRVRRAVLQPPAPARAGGRGGEGRGDPAAAGDEGRRDAAPGQRSGAAGWRPGRARGADRVPGDLGAVELLVGPGHQFQRVRLVAGGGGDAQRQVDLAGVEARRHQFGGLAAEPLGEFHRAVEVGARQEDGELVAAQPRDQVARADAAATAAPATWRSASSPPGWPWRSLMCLKWSMSSSTTPTTECALAGLGAGAGQLGVPAPAVGQAGERVLVAEPLELGEQDARCAAARARGGRASAAPGCSARSGAGARGRR